MAEQCFCSDNGNGCCPNGGTQQSGSGSAQDDHGHGTNVSGIITGTGNTAPQGGAPDAEIVAIKVLDSNNAFCCTSDIVAGLDWILDNRSDVDLVNMSLGTSTLYSGHCDQANASTMALSAAIGELRDRGVTVFASTGNQGSGSQTAAPACVRHTIAVAATYDDDHGSQTWGTTCTDTTTDVDQVTASPTPARPRTSWHRAPSRPRPAWAAAPRPMPGPRRQPCGRGVRRGASRPRPLPQAAPDLARPEDLFRVAGRSQERLCLSAPGLLSGLRRLPIFSDVPASYWAREWIEEIYLQGVTAGCATSPLSYCPGTATTRDQMAVFLLRAKLGSAYTPPSCTGIFADVPCTNPYAPWIEDLYNRGITGGCNTSPLSYCPTSSVSRDQMAVLVLRTLLGTSYTRPLAPGLSATSPAPASTRPGSKTSTAAASPPAAPPHR